MKIHIEAKSPSPRAIVRLLNGLIILRYGLAATRSISDTRTLASAYRERSPRSYSDGMFMLLTALGHPMVVVSDLPYFESYASLFSREEIVQPLRWDANVLEQFPFSIFPLEGFALEVLVKEKFDDKGFDIVSLQRGSIVFVIEDGLEQVCEWLKRLLGRALDLSQAKNSSERITRRQNTYQDLETAMREGPAYASLQSPDVLENRDIVGGLLLIGSETSQSAFSDMGATSLSITDSNPG